MSGNYAAFLVGMIAGGFLADAVGARWTWALAAIVAGAAALIGYSLARGASDAPAVAPEEAAAGGRGGGNGNASRLDSRGCEPARLDYDALVDGVRAGGKRALARAITLVENSDPVAYDLVRELYPETGKAYAVGVTGRPASASRR